MCSILYHWVCVYWCPRTIWLSMFVDGSSYVSFPRPSILCIHFVVHFESEMSDLLLGALGHCPFHHYVLWWRDFISRLIWANYYSTSCYLLHYHPRFLFQFILFVSPLILFLQRPISGLIFSLHHHYTSHYQFDFLHCLVILIIFTLGTLRSIAHEIFCTCCISYIRAWVLIIGYLDLASLHFYHPITLAYITSRVLRPPWGHEIRCRLRQPPLGQVFEIWSIFGYHHASSSRRHFLTFGPDSVVDLDDWDYTFDYGWFEVIQFSDLPYTYAILGHISLSIEIYKSSWSHMILTTHGMHDELIVYCYLIMIP